MIKDTRYVTGAMCTWNGPIQQVKVNNFYLPCCPFCFGTLFEYENETKYLEGVDEFTEKHPNYKKFIEWIKGKCFSGRDYKKEYHKIAASKFTEETGLEVTWLS